MDNMQILTINYFNMLKYSGREIEFNNTVDDYYGSLSSAILWEEWQEYVFTSPSSKRSK